MRVIEAPKGRYRIEERAGRLIVTDVTTGVTGDSAVLAAADRAERRANAAAPRTAVQASADAEEAKRVSAPDAPEPDVPMMHAPTPGSTPPDPAEQVAAIWLGNARDASGRLLLKRRGARSVALDPAQARRLGQPLLVMAIVPVVTVILMVSFVSFIPLLLGGIALYRLWADWYVKTRDEIAAAG